MAEPVTLTEAKAQCRMVEDDSEDAFITSLIAPARAYVERVSRFALIAGSYTETFRRWGDYLEIWRRPIVSIDTVEYSTSDDSAYDEEYTGFAFNINDYPVRISPAYGGTGFPELATGATISVTYTTGALADTSEEYLIAKRAILLLIGHWFENREAAVLGVASAEVDFAVRSLLDELRPVSAY